MQDHFPHLLNLIGFCLRVSGLQIQDLVDSVHREDVVIAPDPLRESKPLEQHAQTVERDIGIRVPKQNIPVQLIVFSHDGTFGRFQNGNVFNDAQAPLGRARILGTDFLQHQLRQENLVHPRDAYLTP